MILLLQAILGSVVALAMVFVNSINTYYWMLTALVAQTVLPRPGGTRTSSGGSWSRSDPASRCRSCS
jgi:hypothetical protein